MQEVLKYLKDKLEEERQTCKFYEQRAAKCERGTEAYFINRMAAQFRYGCISAYRDAIQAIERAGATK